MIDILDDVDRWLTAGRRVVLSTVVAIEGSGPRGPGAHMAVNDLGQIAGSVSGGCIEGAVVSESLDLLRPGTTPQTRSVSYGISDPLAMSVGLTCGGTVHLFLETIDAATVGPVHRALRDALRSDSPLAVCTIVGVHDGAVQVGAKLAVQPGVPGDPLIGSLGDPDLDRRVAREAPALLARGRTEQREFTVPDDSPQGPPEAATATVFIESFATRPHLVAFGAIDVTRALVRLAGVLGYRTTVCDPRAPFATVERFPEADEVVVDWPHRYLERTCVDDRTVICVLTHDPKVDVPALVAAVTTPAGYIGAMGSRRTTADRVPRLREAGLDDAALSRIASPIGLDLGARTPEETALAILAEVVALRAGRHGGRLADGTGSIHA